MDTVSTRHASQSSLRYVYYVLCKCMTDHKRIWYHTENVAIRLPIFMSTSLQTNVLVYIFYVLLFIIICRFVKGQAKFTLWVCRDKPLAKIYHWDSWYRIWLLLSFQSCLLPSVDLIANYSLNHLLVFTYCKQSTYVWNLQHSSTSHH